MDPNSPVDSDEWILRRVPEDKMNLDRDGVLPALFQPRSRDTDGYSVFRERFHSVEDVGVRLRGKGNKPSWVARIRAAEIMELGLSLTPDPRDEFDPPTPGHALIPELNAAIAKNDPEWWELYRKLATAVGSNIEGPFDPPS